MKCIPLLYTVGALVLLSTGCSTDPKVRSNRDVEKGDSYYKRGRLKEASIMYRHALQKNLRNAQAWYKLGLINLSQAAMGEGRGDLIRAVDLAASDKKWDAMTQDAIVKIADIDYAGYSRYPDKLKDYYQDLKARADMLQQHYRNSFEAHRILGLATYADAVGLKKREERQPIVEDALTEFKRADAIKPYDPSVGFAVVSTLAEDGQVPEAERYASEMIKRKTADERVYSSLYWFYLGSNRIAEAETIRKKQVENMPKDGNSYIALATHYFLTKNKTQMEQTLARLTGNPKDFPNANMQVGDFYLSVGDLSDAVPYYEQGAKSDAANKNLYMKKAAEALSLQAKYEEAGKIVAQLLKVDANDPEVIAMDASLQLNHAKREDADKIIARLQPLLAKVTANEPERAVILHFNLGRAYALRGDPQSLDQARVQFEESLKARNPNKEERRAPYLPATMALAQLELQRGSNPQALEYANQVIRHDPTNLPARLIRTMALSGMDEREKARQELNALIAQKPDSADAHFQLARLDILQKKYPDAEKEFEVLRKLNDPRGFAGLIDSRVAQGKQGDAVAMIQNELNKSPDNVPYRVSLANLYFTTGKYSEASKEYRTVIEKAKSPNATVKESWYLKLGESLRHLNDNSAAQDAFMKASQVAPKDATPRLELGLLLEGLDRKEEARQYYEDVLKMEPDNPIALNNLAYYKASTGNDLNTALTYAQRARDKAPQDPNILDTLGLIYYKKDLTEDSMRILSDLVEKYPSNPTFRLHLALVLVKKGDTAKAKRELTNASHNSPSPSEQTQIKALMSKLG